MNHRHPDSKILIDLPADGGYGRFREESLHAVSLGSDLYEVLNVPLLATELHLHDIVRCASGTGLPRVAAVVTPSGFGTAHLIVTEAMDEAAQAALIAALRRLGCVVERGFGVYGIGVPPTLDRAVVGALLDDAYDQGHVTYEAHW